MDEHWKTLTFGDLRPGDTVKLDEEGPEETVRSTYSMLTGRPGSERWIHTDLSCGYRDKADPVLVRFPRPEAAS